MKRGTPRHPKMLRLLQALDLSPRHKATAVGHLELLWHFTAEFSPQGDIGRYGDDQIEGACEWYGRRGRLIQALTTSGWVDISDKYRLIVHDWKDHADESVRKRLTRGGLWFVEVTSKVTGHRQNKVSSVPDNGSLPEPCLARAKPEPEPNTPATPEFTLTPKESNAETPPDQPRVVRPDVQAAPSETADHLSPCGIAIQEIAQSMHDRHPALRRCSCAEIETKLRAILKHEGVKGNAKIDRLVAIERNHAAWCSTTKWTEEAGKFAKGLDNWLAPTIGRFNEPPPANGGAPPGVRLVPPGTKFHPFDPFNPRHHQNEDSADVH